MAGFKNVLNLSIEPTMGIHKKYLGEADDPHFIPDSPIIERQHFSAQEEGELKRLCALALAQIPHSDDMNEDPFKYIVGAVQPGAAPVPAATKPTAIPLPKPSLPKFAPQHAATAAPALQGTTNTATPSDSSKRDTFDRTNYSTPLTSAGVTPAETTKRFSDTVPRPSTSKPSSNAKHAVPQQSKSRAASATRATTKTHDRKASKDTTKNTVKTTIQKPTKNIKQSIKLVQQTPRQSEAHTESSAVVRPQRFSAMELNKTLPPLPRSESAPVAQTSRSNFLKTIKKQKSQVLEGQNPSISTTASPKPPMISKFNTSTIPVFSSKPKQVIAPPEPTPEQKPKKFFKIFSNRKAVPTPVVVSL